MNATKVTQVLRGYEMDLRDRGASSVRLDTTENQLLITDLTSGQILNHLCWLCENGAVLAEAGKLDKAFRWLGFIQGALWAYGFHSIHCLKKDNMPLLDDIH